MGRSFNGTSDGISTVKSFGSGTIFQNCSFGLWVNPNTVGPQFQVFMELGDVQTGNPGSFSPYVGYDFGLNASGAVAAVFDGGTKEAIGGTVVDGKWHHVLVRIQRGVSIDLFVDKVLIQSTAIGTPFAGYTNCYWRLGNGTMIANTGSFYKGLMAEAAVWTAVLDQSEISLLAAGLPPYLVRPAQLVSYWPLNGVSSPELDWSGQFNAGVLAGTSYGDHAPQVLYPTNEWFDRAISVPGGGPTFIPAWAIGRNRVFEGYAS